MQPRVKLEGIRDETEQDAWHYRTTGGAKDPEWQVTVNRARSSMQTGDREYFTCHLKRDGLPMGHASTEFDSVEAAIDWAKFYIGEYQDDP